MIPKSSMFDSSAILCPILAVMNLQYVDISPIRQKQCWISAIFHNHWFPSYPCNGERTTLSFPLWSKMETGPPKWPVRMLLVLGVTLVQKINYFCWNLFQIKDTRSHLPTESASQPAIKPPKDRNPLTSSPASSWTISRLGKTLFNLSWALSSAVAMLVPVNWWTKKIMLAFDKQDH